MARYKITGPDGNPYEVTAPDSASQEEVLNYAKQNYQKSQEPSAFQKYGKALPIGGAVVGGVLGNVPGAMLGGGAGEAARQLLGRGLGEQSPSTPLEAAKGIGVEGALSGAGEGAGRALGFAARPLAKPAAALGAKIGKTGSRAVEAITGLKVPDVMQAARQGVKTYLAPGMEKAQSIFGSALEKAGISSARPAEQVIDPQLAMARKVAIEAKRSLDQAKKMGIGISPEQALRGRQAMDRVIASTPLKDRATRGELMEIRSQLDDAVSRSSGDLKNASNIYRQAVVKSNILEPLKITKQGQMSAVSPMLGLMAGAVGGRHGDTGEALASGAGAMAAQSPALWGAGITGGADLARIAVSPASRSALIQTLLREYIRKRNANPNP